MHAQDRLLGQEEIQNGEHGLLDLARVRGPADKDQALAEVDQDKGLGIGFVQFGNSLEIGRLDDGELGLVQSF